MLKWILGVFGFLTALFLVESLLVRVGSARRRKRLTSRKAMEAGDWHTRHFASAGVTIDASMGVAEIFAKHLACEPTQLRPTDTLDGELSITRWTILGFDNDDAWDAIEEELNEATENGNSEKAITQAARDLTTLLDVALWFQKHRAAPGSSD